MGAVAAQQFPTAGPQGGSGMASTRHALRRDPTCGSSLAGGSQESRKAVMGISGHAGLPGAQPAKLRQRGAQRQQQRDSCLSPPKPGFRSKRRATLHAPKITPVKNQQNTERLSGAAGLGRRERNCLVFILPPPQQLQQVLAHKTAVKIPVLVQMLGDEGS